MVSRYTLEVMASLYSPRANLIAKVLVMVPPLAVLAISAALFAYNYSPYVTGVGVPVSQPVPFSHAHHVGGLGIDCRYCHTGVEDSSFAGLPTSQTCMNCHSQLYTLAPLLDPVRQSWQTGEPIKWNRVNQVPDFTYFNHGVHVKAGVGCVTCHGRVDEMPLMWKGQTLYMQWCLSCHREPRDKLRPPEQVFSMEPWRPSPSEPRPVLDRLWKRDDRSVYALHTASITNCSACHR